MALYKSALEYIKKDDPTSTKALKGIASGVAGFAVSSFLHKRRIKQAMDLTKRYYMSLGATSEGANRAVFNTLLNTTGKSLLGSVVAGAGLGVASGSLESRRRR